MRLDQFKALSFDCYGTLIDWESGMIDGLRPLTSQLERPVPHDSVLQAHAFYESSQQAQTPAMRYSDILAVVYKRLAEEWGISVSHDACVDYGKSVKNWPVFDDSVEALKYLEQHYRLIILSNVDNESFYASQQKLQVEFDAVYTAEDIGSYKPSAGNFDYMMTSIERLGLSGPDLLHTAESLFHDHVPAKRHGLSNCWIYRRHNKKGYGATMEPDERPKTDFQYNSLADMVTAHRQLTGK